MQLSGTQNSWGIYGMAMIGPAGLNAFLRGLDNQSYLNSGSGIIQDVSTVTMTQAALDNCSYYGIFPSPNQTATRALAATITTTYNLKMGTLLFNVKNNYIPGAVFNHVFRGSTDTTGSLLAVGVTRVPDVRISAVGILSDFNPTVYKSQYTAAGSSKLIVLQLGLAGGK
jgi:hypothetical protein